MVIWSRTSILGDFVDICVMRVGPFLKTWFWALAETPQMAKNLRFSEFFKPSRLENEKNLKKFLKTKTSQLVNIVHKNAL